MSQNLKFVQDFLDDAPVTDVSTIFAEWTDIIDGLKEKVMARFDLERDPSTEELEAFASDVDGGPSGSVRAYTGPDVDWMIHSHMQNKGLGFVNVHLTIWLGPHIDVPHFGMALGAFPQGWMFMDSVPRKLIPTDLDYYKKYYEPFNAEWEQIHKNTPGVEEFVSRDAFVRATYSPTAWSFMGPGSQELFDLARTTANAHLDRWLQWVDEAVEVPADKRAELAANDLATRRNIAELDPANVVAVRYFGEERTDQLVRALWGGDRVLPRPLDA